MTNPTLTKVSYCNWSVGNDGRNRTKIADRTVTLHDWDNDCAPAGSIVVTLSDNTGWESNRKAKHLRVWITPEQLAEIGYVPAEKQPH